MPNYERLAEITHCDGAFKRYIENGLQPGGFCTAVLSNDLFAACARADSGNLKAIPELVKWIYNEAPSGCWGSASDVVAWCKSGGLEGQRKAKAAQAAA